VASRTVLILPKARAARRRCVVVPGSVCRLKGVKGFWLVSIAGLFVGGRGGAAVAARLCCRCWKDGAGCVNWLLQGTCVVSVQLAVSNNVWGSGNVVGLRW